jgi:formate dehydrogenase major subunit
VTEHSQGSTMVMGIANLAMATGNIGREGVGVNPLRGQNNVQGACDMGSFPHELPGYRHVSDEHVRALFEGAWGVALTREPGLRIPNMFDAALDGSFKGLYMPGRGHRAVGPEHPARDRGADGDGVRGRAGSLPERDGQVRPCVSARLVVPGEGRHLHQRRAAHLAGAQGDAAAGRAKADWEVTLALSAALGYPMHYEPPVADHGRDRRADAELHAGVSYEKLDRLGSIQWPCNAGAPDGTAGPCTRRVRARQGPLHGHEYVADRREGQRAASR